MESNERLLLLKLMNGLYGASLADNAQNTQKFLSEMIPFLKYYTSEEQRLVKLKDELAVIRLFGEMMTSGTGNSYSIAINLQDDETGNLYIPSKSLLQLTLDILVFQNEMPAGQGTMTVEAKRAEQGVLISFTGGFLSDTGVLRQRADEVKKAFEDALGFSACIELKRGDGREDAE